MTLGVFTEWALHVDLFPVEGPLGRRYEASFFIARNFVRPLTWLGVLEESPMNAPGTSMMDRQFRKTIIFDGFFRITPPTGFTTVVAH
ncbi:hypothetical protein BG46_17540 [Brucella anthropi]|nr:hypothetical protein BG46_17540 [Brucella anthropi]